MSNGASGEDLDPAVHMSGRVTIIARENDKSCIAQNIPVDIFHSHSKRRVGLGLPTYPSFGTLTPYEEVNLVSKLPKFVHGM